MKPAILVVEDDTDTLDSLVELLDLQGYQAEKADSIAKAETVLAERNVDGVLLDLSLPDGNGLEWIHSLRQRQPHSALIITTGNDDVSTAVDAIHRGADNYLIKPIDRNALEIALQKSLELEALKRRDVTRKRLDKQERVILGESGPARQAWDLAGKAARNEAAVLIQGETGSGKGVLARWIHENSPLADESFVEVNCSSLKGELLASELFGHRKGAFTSAVENREGLIEVADGGTLFLDEIGDMDIGVQAQFLKVIEEKEFRRLGESKTRRSDFRLICATNRDLEAEADQGNFRRDLFFRICVFPIHVPPLRKRLDDLPALVSHLLSNLGREGYEVSDEVMARLRTYDWPGNVRELRNILERACLLAEGNEITCEHLIGIGPDGHGEAGGSFSAAPDDWSMEAQEAQHVQRALEHFDGNVGEAASAMGISRATLYRKLKKYDILPSKA
jgi:DNA-binding NtrC family response regulator